MAMTLHLSSKYSLIYELSDHRRDELHQLYQQMWWSNTRTRADVDTILAHSLSIGLVDEETDRLIGFTRIVSDHFKYAFIFDVLLEESYRGRGLGKYLMDAALNHEALQKITAFELHCVEDKVSFYEQFGFSKDFGTAQALRLIRKPHLPKSA